MAEDKPQAERRKYPRPPKKDKELAVALKYTQGVDPAPKVVAKGQGEIAAQIIKVAKEHGIEIREDAPLVEMLSMLEIDSLIPLEAYAAVAEILAYIYKSNRELGSKRQKQSPIDQMS